MRAPNTSSACRVLFVDDDAHVLRALSRLLRRRFHCIHTALDGEKALATLASHPIDVIVTDSLASPLSGLELLRRAKELFPTMGTIVLSGKTELTDVWQARQDGVLHAYLPKPWDDDVLVDVITRVYEACAALRSSVP